MTNEVKLKAIELANILITIAIAPNVIEVLDWKKIEEDCRSLVAALEG